MYPHIEPYDHGMLTVDAVDQLYWEVCGNPRGKPAVVFHGGPGSGCNPGWRRFFDPGAYRVILFDPAWLRSQHPCARKPRVTGATGKIHTSPYAPSSTRPALRGPGVPDDLRAPGYPLLASCRVARGRHPATEHRQTRPYPWRTGPRSSGREQPARRALGACAAVAVKRADRCGRGRAFVGRTWHVRNARSRYRSIRTAAIAALSSTRGAELLARVRGSATPDRVDERLQPGADGRHGPVQATATASLSPSSIR